MMEKAAASEADEVFLDLEDACAPLEKPAARGKVVEALRGHEWSGDALEAASGPMIAPKRYSGSRRQSRISRRF